jgi:DNA invertase Pin-like site-specific DNA recombinase
MTVFGYVRVSTLQQATEGESLETQKKQVLGYAESRGLKLSCEDVFIEKGVSGGAEFKTRPQGARLLESLTDGDTVIFKAYCETEGQVRIGFGECQTLIVS